MEENYIHIFSSFLADCLKDEKLSLKDVYLLMQAFEPVCDNIKTREELVVFVDQFTDKYWELKELKKQLLDINFKFE